MSITLTATGEITGELTHHGDQPAKVAGELRNQGMLGLSFDLSSTLRVFATGKSFQVVHRRSDLPMSGTTHGPRAGDTGVCFNAFWDEV